MLLAGGYIAGATLLHVAEYGVSGQIIAGKAKNVNIYHIFLVNSGPIALPALACEPRHNSDAV
jgi:hypothetical protein